MKQTSIEWLIENVISDYGKIIKSNEIKIATEMYKKEMQNTFISDEEFNKIYNDLTRVYTLPMYKDISTDYQNGYLHGVLWLYTFLKNKQ
jgi:hypothetical protein